MAAPTPDERLDFIIQEKLGRRWNHYASVRQYAQEWGIDIRVVAQSSAEADRCIARMYAASPEKTEEARGMILPEIDDWMKEAQKAGEFSALAQLLKLKVAVVGAMAPSHSIRETKHTSNDYDKLPTEEKIRLHREALAAEERKLEAERAAKEATLQ